MGINLLFGILIFLLIAVSGAAGGVIGNFWRENVTIDGTDKYDIFIGLLTSLIALLGLAFGGLGIATYNILSRSLTTRSREISRELSEEMESEVRRSIARKLVHFESYLATLFYQMSEALGEDNPELAKAYLDQFGFLNESALENARKRLPDYENNEVERELVLDAINNIAMYSVLSGDSDKEYMAHKLVDELEPWALKLEQNIWHYLETVYRVRYLMGRSPQEREDARKAAEQLLKHPDISADKGKELRKRYDL